MPASVASAVAIGMPAVVVVNGALEQLPPGQWPALADATEELGKALITLAASGAFDIPDPGYQLMVGLVTWILWWLMAKTTRGGRPDSRIP